MFAELVDIEGSNQNGLEPGIEFKINQKMLKIGKECDIHKVFKCWEDIMFVLSQ